MPTFAEKDPWTGRIGHVHGNAETAAVAFVEHGARGCDGQLERLQGRLEALTVLVGRILDEAAVPADQLERIFGGMFEVQP